MHEGSKSVRGSSSRDKAQADINDNDADEDEDGDDNDNDGGSRQCTETHALLVTSAHASDDLVYPSTTSSPSSSPTPPPKLRHQQPRPSENREKNENPTRKSSAEAIQEAAAFLYAEGTGEVKRRKRRQRAKQRKVIGNLKDFYEKPLEAPPEGIVPSASEVCEVFARRTDSPVYSDRFVYNQQPLLAREVTLLQTGRGHAVFIPISRLDEDVDFMPIYKLDKSNASGIFYSTGLSAEAIDLKSSLEPSILLLDSPRSFPSAESDCSPFYRQFLDKGYSRVSGRGTAERRIAQFEDNEDFRIDMESKADEAARRERAGDSERNCRSSLLMLEPLLLMSPETASRGVNYKKKRLAHAEHLKLVRIVIAYSLTFVILVSITYYVVYFT